MKKLFLLLIAILLLHNCDILSKKAKKETKNSHHSESITKVFDSHGGFENWSKMKWLTYEIDSGEKHIVSLLDRKIRIEGKDRVIGFDGENVWVSPDTITASRARFYHNLYFYFFAMPFVLGDKGVLYEDIPNKEIKGKIYEGIKISFGENIGDSPKDNYIVWLDAKTKKMEWLMYTVTYNSKEISNNYNLIKYDNWKDFNGVILPTSLKWYSFENDSVGKMSGERVFDKINLLENSFDKKIFEIPAENYQIAPK